MSRELVFWSFIAATALVYMGQGGSPFVVAAGIACFEFVQWVKGARSR